MINNFRDKQARIKVIQDRADSYNRRFDELEEKGEDLIKIPEILAEQDMQSRHHQYTGLNENPYEKKDQIISMTGRMGQGYNGAHQVMSQTKDQYSTVDKLFKDSKINKGKSIYADTNQKQATSKMERREQIYKDHVRNLFQIDPTLVEKKTDYGVNFKYEEAMKKLHSERNYEYHQKMNDLKWYNEEYVKSRDYLRKC